MPGSASPEFDADRQLKPGEPLVQALPLKSFVRRQPSPKVLQAGPVPAQWVQPKQEPDIARMDFHPRHDVPEQPVLKVFFGNIGQRSDLCANQPLYRGRSDPADRLDIVGAGDWRRDVVGVPGPSAFPVDAKHHRLAVCVEQDPVKKRSSANGDMCSAPAAARQESLGRIERHPVKDRRMLSSVCNALLDDVSYIDPIAEEVPERSAAEVTAAHVPAAPGPVAL